MPVPMNPTLITAATLTVAVLGMAGALNSYQVSARYAEQFPDAYGVERAQARFAPLNARVEASAELGYFTDLDAPQPAYAAALLAARYAVAPRVLIVVDGSTGRPEWAAGNFSKPVDFAAAGKARGYEMIADLGNGLVLFRRQ